MRQYEDFSTSLLEITGLKAVRKEWPFAVCLIGPLDIEWVSRQQIKLVLLKK